MSTFEFEPAEGGAPMLGPTSLAAARVRAATWARWARSPPAFATEVAEDLVAQLAIAATLAERPAAVLAAWVDNFGEPIEILTAYERLDSAAWLAVLEQRRDDDLAGVREHALTLVAGALLDPVTAVAPLSAETPWVYDSLVGWLDGFFWPVARRCAGATKQPWCEQWWRHPEAVQRLNALWRSWEAMRGGPEPAWSTWWTSHFDEHMAQLTHVERGPFSQCGTGHRDYEEELPHEKPPAHWRLPTQEANQP